jgi:hypothetical protein
MRKSEIFDEFVKVAQDKGLVSSDKSYRALEKNPRADSLSVDDIAKLYQVKNESPKNMNYKNNIMEIAHTSSAIVSPAYDRINGLFENNIERQNIMLNIVNKRNDGLLTQKKYAEHELMMSLIKISNRLSQENNPELKNLSDACLKQAESNQNQLRKNAVLDPMTWAIIGTVVAALAGLYVHQHIDEADRGFELNHENLKKEVTDLVESESSFGVGYDFSDDFKDIMSQFSDKLDEFYALYEKIKPLITTIEKPRTKKELIEFAKSPQGDMFIKAYNTFKDASANMSEYLKKVKQNFERQDYKKRQITDSGSLTDMADRLKLHGGPGLIKDDFDDVRRAIPPYMESIESMLKVLKSAERLKNLAKRQLESAKSKTTSTGAPDFRSMDQTSPSYKPSVPGTPGSSGSPGTPGTSGSSGPSGII